MIQEIKIYSPYLGIALICLFVSNLIPDIGICMNGGECRLAIWDLSHDILRDIGIAVLVGVFIAVVLEARHRKNIEGIFKNSLQEFKETIGDGLMRAIYARKLPDLMLRTVKETVFEKDFLREDARIEIRLYNFSENCISNIAPASIREKLLTFQRTIEQNSSFLNKDSLVLMKLKFGFTIKNINDENENESFPAKFSMKIPFHHSLKNLCDVFSITVDGEQKIACFERTSVDGELLYSLKNNDKNAVMVKRGKSVRLEYEALSVRWQDDQEVFSMITPTQGLRVIAEDGNGDKILSIIPKFKDVALKEVIAKNAETNTAELLSKACLLPFQGVLIRWSPDFDQTLLPQAETAAL